MCRLAFLLQGLQRKMLVWVGLEGTMFLWQELQIFHLISLLSSASVTLSLVFWFQPCFVWQSSYHCEVTNESLLRALSHVLSTICGTVSKTVKLLVKKEAKTDMSAMSTIYTIVYGRWCDHYHHRPFTYGIGSCPEVNVLYVSQLQPN